MKINYKQPHQSLVKGPRGAKALLLQTPANSVTGVVVFTGKPWWTLGLEAPAFVYGDTKRKPEGSARDKPSWRREGAGD